MLPLKKAMVLQKNRSTDILFGRGQKLKKITLIRNRLLLSKITLLDLLAWYLDYFFHKKIINEFSTWKINKVWQEFFFLLVKFLIFYPLFSAYFQVLPARTCWKIKLLHISGVQKIVQKLENPLKFHWGM